MECGLPAPSMRYFRRETCIVVPIFVEKFVAAVREIAPRQRRDGINDIAQLIFGLFMFGNIAAHAVNAPAIGRGVPRYPMISAVLGAHAIFKAQNLLSVGDAAQFGAGSFAIVRVQQPLVG